MYYKKGDSCFWTLENTNKQRNHFIYKKRKNIKENRKIEKFTDFNKFCRNTNTVNHAKQYSIGTKKKKRLNFVHQYEC